MLYIERNEHGEIDNIEFSPGPNREEVSLHDPKFQKYIEDAPNSDEIIVRVLNRLDLDMVRVIEDVIDIMIDRNLILFTDLPDPVQNKILFKKSIRNLSNKDKTVLDEEELINF